MKHIDHDELRKKLVEFADNLTRSRSLDVEKWRPGLVATLRVPIIKDDDLATSLFLVLAEAGEGSWLCAKMSPFKIDSGSWDYRLEAGAWPNGFYSLVEVDLTEVIPQEALGEPAAAQIPAALLAEIQALHRLYQSEAPAPHSERDQDGLLMNFKLDEEYFMERLRLYLYYGWSGLEERAAYLWRAAQRSRAALRLAALKSEKLSAPEENFSSAFFDQLRALPDDFFEGEQSPEPVPVDEAAEFSEYPDAYLSSPARWAAASLTLSVEINKNNFEPCYASIDKRPLQVSFVCHYVPQPYKVQAMLWDSDMGGPVPLMVEGRPEVLVRLISDVEVRGELSEPFEDSSAWSLVVFVAEENEKTVEKI